MISKTSARADYLGRVARNGEPDRYLSALLAPANVRALLLALAAYSAELRHIPEAVKREPLMGEIRLQWWRDTLHALAKGERVGHPVADVLGGGICDGHLPLRLLLDVTDARAFDFTPGPFANEQALRVYLEHTECKLFLLATRVLGVTDASLDLTCRAAGEAYGLARLLLDLPHALARGCLRLAVRAEGSSELELALRSGQELKPGDLVKLKEVDQEAQLAGIGFAVLRPATEVWRPLGEVGDVAVVERPQDYGHDQLAHVVRREVVILPIWLA